MAPTPPQIPETFDGQTQGWWSRQVSRFFGQKNSPAEPLEERALNEDERPPRPARTLQPVNPAGKTQGIHIPGDREIDDAIEQWPVQGLPGVGTIFGWDVNTLMLAMRAHTAGSFAQSGRLVDDIKTNPIMRHGINTRREFKTTLPLTVLPGGRGVRGGQSPPEAVRFADFWKEVRPEILKPSILDDWWLHNNFMGFSDSVMEWEERTDGRDRWWLPRIKPWHPSQQYVSYRPDLGATSPDGMVMFAMTRNGPAVVNKGDGRWIHFQKGELSPWLNGLVRVLAETFLGDTYTLRDNMALMEQYGQGIKKLIHPASWKASEVNQKIQILRSAGHGGVISCPVDSNGKKVDVENLQIDPSGANIFELTEARLLKRILIVLLGQNMTTVGQTGGYAQAAIHAGVLWQKREEDAGDFGDAQLVMELDANGKEKRFWLPTTGTIRGDITRWIAYFNAGSFDLAPFTYFNAIMPEDKAAMETAQAGAISSKATALANVSHAIMGSEKGPGIAAALRGAGAPELKADDLEFIFSQAGFRLRAPKDVK